MSVSLDINENIDNSGNISIQDASNSLILHKMKSLLTDEMTIDMSSIKIRRPLDILK
jgi:hypothetical protein